VRAGTSGGCAPVDTLRLVLAVIVTAASVSDPAGARLLFTRLSGACKKLWLIWVNGTYRGQLVEWGAQHRRFVLRVTLRPDGCKGFELPPRRWVVERPWAWLYQSRRLSKDYERRSYWMPESWQARMAYTDASLCSNLLTGVQRGRSTSRGWTMRCSVIRPSAHYAGQTAAPAPLVSPHRSSSVVGRTRNRHGSARRGAPVTNAVMLWPTPALPAIIRLLAHVQPQTIEPLLKDPLMPGTRG